MLITATGIKFGSEMKVIYKDGNVTFNDYPDVQFEKELKKGMI